MLVIQIRLGEEKWVDDDLEVKAFLGVSIDEETWVEDDLNGHISSDNSI